MALRPEVILAHIAQVTAALQRETRVIPIVFVNVSDPIGAGFVSNLARPGGNLTGLLQYEEGIIGKWLSLLKEIAPSLVRVALMADPRSSVHDYFVRNAKAAAASLALELVSTPVENNGDIERSLDTFARQPNGGLLLPPDATTITHRGLVIALAAALGGQSGHVANGTNSTLLTRSGHGNDQFCCDAQQEYPLPV